MLKTRSILETLDKQKASFLREVAVMAATHGPASAADWSAAQIVEHLAKVENGFTEGIRRGLAQQNPPPTLTQKLRVLPLLAVLVSPMRMPMPPKAASAIAPGADAELEAAIEAWAAARKRLHDLLAPIKTLPSGAIFRHPVAGWLNLVDTMRVMRAHHFHHLYQLRRLKRLS